MPWLDLFSRVGPILGFLVCITVVAELADGIGVFATVARGAARVARGSVLGLWLIVVVVAVLATAVLSLDTTAVLLTPVVLNLTRQFDLDQPLFAYTTVWLANTASLFLPVSNLTNLLAVSGPNGPLRSGFVGTMAPAATVSVVVTTLLLAVLFRRSLRGRYQPAPREPVLHRGLLVLALVTCAALGPAFVLGVNVLIAAGVAATVLIIGCAVAARPLLRWRLVPWMLVLGVAALFVVVQFARYAGLDTVLGSVAGRGTGWVALLRVSGVGALASNVVDNLPAYLALEPSSHGSALRLGALLVGVNAGPLITPWGSVATLIWAGRCRSAGVTVSWTGFAWRGLLLVPLVIFAATTALWASGTLMTR